MNEHITLKERLQTVIDNIEAGANEDWNNSQDVQEKMKHHLIGRSNGGLNAVKLIKAEFSELFGGSRDDEYFAAPSDYPVEPFTYIDNADILFRDRYGRFWFWDETYTVARGPYSNNPKACAAMRQHAQEEAT